MGDQEGGGEGKWGLGEVGRRGGGSGSRRGGEVGRYGGVGIKKWDGTEGWGSRSGMVRRGGDQEVGWYGGVGIKKWDGTEGWGSGSRRGEEVGRYGEVGDKEVEINGTEERDQEVGTGIDGAE